MTKDELWAAVVENDAAYDGVFFYGVKTTQIFCRPSCKSKIPNRENVMFFQNSQEARDAGFTPCKRCRSDLVDYRPKLEIAAELHDVLDETWNKPLLMREKMQGIGISRHRASEIFKDVYGKTFTEYVTELRLSAVKKLLCEGDMHIIDIAYATGFESLSTFYRFFKKETGFAPAAYRKSLCKK